MISFDSSSSPIALTEFHRELFHVGLAIQAARPRRKRRFQTAAPCHLPDRVRGAPENPGSLKRSNQLHARSFLLA
jgi:hypothetical protein